ncbi:DUF397 domain-containing protein [Actinomadura harenae]|uniref:DUF397 domain-containing protein n=1 Tax=Actinomadura harenae TaxID=2483351 RepID=A0A3M2LLW4_9ACTN|nr:DUF397 domain-containing protein [Actinomadura harenae]RMI38411.1 DUF397 domain-containing protein [Actinomadura harenae]
MVEKWDAQSWRKSSHSPGWDDCVEMAGAASVVGVRDSKDSGGPVLEFSRRETAELLNHVRAVVDGSAVRA